MALIGPRNVAFLAAGVIGLAADQISKAAVIAWLGRTDEVEVIPGWFSLVHAQNHGAAFSLLEGQRYLFLAFTVVACVVVFDLVRRLPRDRAFVAATLGLVIGGALGNAVDRVRLGYVTDFLRVYTEWPPLATRLVDTFGTATWPVFNVADILLVVGIAIYVLFGSRDAGHPTGEETPAGRPASTT